MNDLLYEVIEAISNRKKIPPTTSKNVITLLSFFSFKSEDIPKIRNFQEHIAKLFNVKLIVIGGGYGCSRINFSVVASSPKKASEFIKDILDSQIFRQEALEANFSILITDKPYERVDLKSGKKDGYSNIAINVNLGVDIMEKKIDNSVHIGKIGNGPIAIHSKDVKQQVNDINALREFISSFQQQLLDLNFNPNDRQEVNAEIETIETQLKLSRPKPIIIMESLKSLRNVLEGMTGSVLASELIPKITSFITHLKI